MNDITKNIHYGQTWLFADDVSHLIANKNKVSALETAQAGLSDMSAWCKSNNLVLNKDKTVILEFYNRKKPDSTPLLKLDGKFVKFDDKMKYLGITLCADLKWSEHITVNSRLTGSGSTRLRLNRERNWE